MARGRQTGESVMRWQVVLISPELLNISAGVSGEIDVYAKMCVLGQRKKIYAISNR